MTQTKEDQQAQLATHFSNEVIDTELSPKWLRGPKVTGSQE